jgi:hypothetical protein
LILMKGPEAAAHYPDPALRPFGDLAFLFDDPAVAHRAVIASGFVEVGDVAGYKDARHLRPLAWPDLPLVVELQREANRPVWLAPLDTAELLELTRLGATGVADLAEPVPAAHAVLLAAHSWAHEPLRST